MKLRITREDLAQLTTDQRQNLSALWIPQLYDLAVGYICKNVEDDEYDEIEFVVGGVQLYGTHIYLTDLAALGAGNQDQDVPGEEEALPGESNSTGSILTDSFIKVDSAFPISSEEMEQAVEHMEAPLREDPEDEEAYGEEDELGEEELAYNYERPTVFSKEDCVPLLNIGQMIELLHRNHFSSCNFDLTVSTLEYGCQLGKPGSGWDADEVYGDVELCDVLWDAVKRML